MKTEDFMHEVTQTGAIFGRHENVKVVFEGTQANTDGKEIVIPALPAGIELGRDTIMATRGYLDHEAGHLRHTDTQLMQEYSKSVSQSCFSLWNSLEDIWLEERVMKDYPGSKKNFWATEESIGHKEIESINRHLEAFGDNATVDNAGLVIRTLGRKDYSPEELTEQKLAFSSERMKSWGNKWLEELKTCQNSKEVMNLANKIYELLKQEQEQTEEQKQEQGEEQIAGQDVGDFSFDKNSDPCKDGGELCKDEPKEMKQAVPKLGDVKAAFEEMLNGEVQKGLEEASNKTVKWKIASTKFDEVFSKSSVNSREDHRKKLLIEGSSSTYEQIKSGLNGQIHTMKSRLRRALLALERRDWDYGKENGKLDSKRLIAGYQGATSVYKVRKDREEHDTSVLLLVDLSGSMQGGKIETAGESVVAFTECLSGTNIKFSIYGFDHAWTGGLDQEDYPRGFHRTEPQNILEFKSFQEPLRNAKGPISAIQHCANGNNADRDAILWAFHKLKEQPTKRKVLVVLSDGHPYHHTTNGSYHEWSEQALREMVQRDKEFGIECVGIGIRDKTVKSIYKNSVSIDNVSDLSGTIFNKLAEILVGGSKL